MISAIVHTYNEEKNIDRCLTSCKFADEIVLVDMHSRDKTIDIARDHQAKIYTHPYTGFVEPARNFGIEKAKGNYIVIVDADEEVPSFLAQYLVKAEKEGEHDFLRLPRKNLIFGKWIKHAGWWPDYQVRFFKKGKVSWIDKLHGVPITEGKGKNVEKDEKLAIVHHNYESINQYIERLNRYSLQAAKELYLDDEQFLPSKLFQKPAEEFVRRFFYLAGYKDGIYGLALSLLQSFSELAIYLKLWELEGFKEKEISLSEVDRFLKDEKKIKNHWLYHEKLKNESSLVSKIALKLRRKLNTYL